MARGFRRYDPFKLPRLFRSACLSCLRNLPPGQPVNPGICGPCLHKMGFAAFNYKEIRLLGCDSDIDQEKLSSDVVTTATPQSPSRLASQCGHHLKGSDQYETTRDSEFVIQQEKEKLSSVIVTTANQDSASLSSSDQVQRCGSSTRAKLLKTKKKRKASENKNKKKRKAIFTT